MLNTWLNSNCADAMVCILKLDTDYSRNAMAAMVVEYPYGIVVWLHL